LLKLREWRPVGTASMSHNVRQKRKDDRKEICLLVVIASYVVLALILGTFCKHEKRQCSGTYSGHSDRNTTGQAVS